MKDLKWKMWLVFTLSFQGYSLEVKKMAQKDPLLIDIPDIKTQSEEFWKKRLTKEEFRVCRKAGTEVAFSGKYHNNKQEGIYRCVCCGQALFSSSSKFDSGTGWPSFWEPTQKVHVEFKEDNFLIVKRIEVSCSRCGAHLGHVFDDGPPPTGKRYCINAICLRFYEK